MRRFVWCQRAPLTGTVPASWAQAARHAIGTLDGCSLPVRTDGSKENGTRIRAAPWAWPGVQTQPSRPRGTLALLEMRPELSHTGRLFPGPTATASWSPRPRNFLEHPRWWEACPHRPSPGLHVTVTAVTGNCHCLLRLSHGGSASRARSSVLGLEQPGPPRPFPAPGRRLGSESCPIFWPALLRFESAHRSSRQVTLLNPLGLFQDTGPPPGSLVSLPPRPVLLCGHLTSCRTQCFLGA